jgi:septation ring formation regulator EzrA
VINDGIDSERIKRHIKSDDYFRTLARALDLTRDIMTIIEQDIKEIKQDIENIGQVNRRNSKKLEELRDNLVYLQRNYKIIKKK